MLVETERDKEGTDACVVMNEEIMVGGDHRVVMAMLRFGKIPSVRIMRERKIKFWKLKVIKVREKFEGGVRNGT